MERRKLQIAGYSYYGLNRRETKRRLLKLRRKPKAGLVEALRATNRRLGDKPDERKGPFDRRSK